MLPIDVTPAGIVMLARAEHLAKVELSIDVTPAGIVMLAREEQP